MDLETRLTPLLREVSRPDFLSTTRVRNWQRDDRALFLAIALRYRELLPDPTVPELEIIANVLRDAHHAAFRRYAPDRGTAAAPREPPRRRRRAAAYGGAPAAGVQP